VVAVELAGKGTQFESEFGRLCLGAFAHLDEEGVPLGLGNEANDILGVGGCRRRTTHDHGPGGRELCELTHRFLLPWVCRAPSCRERGTDGAERLAFLPSPSSSAKAHAPVN